MLLCFDARFLLVEKMLRGKLHHIIAIVLVWVAHSEGQPKEYIREHCTIHSCTANKNSIHIERQQRKRDYNLAMLLTPPDLSSLG